MQEVENLEIEVDNFRKLPGEAKFAIILNKTKESIKRTLFPVILALLAEFGIKYLQAVLDKIPGAKPDTCPSPERIKEIIRKRDKLVKQLNRFYKMITRASKILGLAEIIIIGIKVGIIASKFVPLRYVPGAFVTVLNKIEKKVRSCWNCGRYFIYVRRYYWNYFSTNNRIIKCFRSFYTKLC